MGGDGYPSEGTYTGILTKNRTMTVVGNPTDARSGRYVIRDAMSLKKIKGYSQMNESFRQNQQNRSFLSHIFGSFDGGTRKELNDTCINRQSLQKVKNCSCILARLIRMLEGKINLHALPFGTSFGLYFLELDSNFNESFSIFGGQRDTDVVVITATV